MDLNFENILRLASPPGGAFLGHTLYALIDHGAVPELTKRLDRFGLGWTSLFEGSRDEGALEVAPVLVPFCREGRMLVSQGACGWICEAARFTTCLSFLLSPLDTGTLARRLALRLDASLPDSVDILLRYFDGRIFESLMEVLGPEQKASFLAVADEWSYVDRAGTIRSEPASFRPQDDELFPLVFDSLQEAQLLERSEPDQVAMMMKDVMPSEFAAIAPAVRFDFIGRNMVIAVGFGIKATHELALFCCLAMQEEGFHMSDAWAEKLNDIRLGTTTLTSAVDGLDTEQ